MNDLVSIIVPVYHAERFIEETLDSVRAQTYGLWELLLVVDGEFQEGAEEIVIRNLEGAIDMVLPEKREPAPDPFHIEVTWNTRK